MQKLKTVPTADVCSGCGFNKHECMCAPEPPAGARRQHHCPLYHLVPIELLEAVADTREGGDLKYQPSNWQQGDLAFFVDCINHTIEHLYGAVDQDNSESLIEHLGHAACNIGFMLWAIRQGKLSRGSFKQAAVIYEEARNAGRVL